MLNYLLPYLIIILLGVFSLISLIKDWGVYKKLWLKIAGLAVIIAIIGLGLINQYYSDKKIKDKEDEASKKEQRDQIEKARLEETVVTSTRNQENNTKRFSEQIGKLSQKVSDLQTQVKTAELKKEVAELQAELQRTQKALQQPKVALTFTFAKSDLDAPAVQTITLPVKDNVVHVEFAFINCSDSPALDGEITLIICDACKFASEPPKFIKLPGQKETSRTYIFQRILQKSELETLKADVQVPPSVLSVEFGVNYRCQNCIIPPLRANIGIIHLDRRR